MATTRSRLAIVAVALVTLAILVRGHSDDDTSSSMALRAPTSSFHARTRGPALAVANASIAGTIRDDGGRGLAGAHVCARSIDASEPMVCTSADAHGAYRVDALVPGQLEVWASANGRRPESYPPGLAVAAGDHRDDVDLVLHPGGVEIHGTIRAVGGAPIAGARVEVGGLGTRTDDAGHYSMWVRPSWVVLQSSADHYANAWRGGPAPGQLDLELSPGSRLTGLVVDDAGEPVAGAAVHAVHADDAREFSDASDLSAISDERGHFAIAGMGAGRYEVNARGSHGYGIAAATPVAPGADVGDVVVRLARGFELVGHVTVPDGTTCLRSALWIEDQRGRRIAATRDGDGTLHVGGLVPGDYLVSPSCVDHLSAAKTPHVVIADRDIDASWSVDTGATIRGRIVTTGGRPLAGADVTASGNPAYENRAGGGDVTATDGTYVIHGLPAGHYDVSTTGWQSASTFQFTATVDVGPQQTTTHDFEIDTAVLGSYGGHVVDSEGRVPRQLRVLLNNAHVMVLPQANADDAGNFFIDGIATGTYTVSVSGDDGDLPIVGGPMTVEIRAGQAVSLDLVVNHPTGSIRGRVVDDHGEPAAGALVAATSDGKLHFESSLQATTDTDGRFVITHLSEATYTVRAFRREGVDTTLASVAVGSDITLKLPAVGSLSGVAHGGAAGLGDLEVQIFDRRDMVVVRTQTFPKSDGHFDIADLPPGDYLVSVTADGVQGQANATITSGERATIDIALPLRVTIVGRVVDARTGEPVPHVVITASRTDSSASDVNWSDDDRRATDASGRFTVAGVPRGPIVVNGSAERDPSGGWVDVKRDTSTGGDVVDVGVIPMVTHAFNNSGDCGCHVGVRDQQAAVDSITADGAGARAGLVEGDIITAVDGIDTTGDRAGLAWLLLGGDVGTSVELTLQRGVTLELVRTP